MCEANKQVLPFCYVNWKTANSHTHTLRASWEFCWNSSKNRSKEKKEKKIGGMVLAMLWQIENHIENEVKCRSRNKFYSNTNIEARNGVLVFTVARESTRTSTNFSFFIKSGQLRDCRNPKQANVARRNRESNCVGEAGCWRTLYRLKVSRNSGRDIHESWQLL